MGKVAELPKPFREQVNQRLHNGRTLREIAEWLNTQADLQPWFAERGHAPFNEQNISNWRQGGWTAWLKQQERYERLQIESQARAAAREEMQRNGIDLTEANAARIMDIVDEVLADFDVKALKEVAAKSPTKAMQVLGDLVGSATTGKAKMAELELKVRRYEEDRAKAKAEIAKLRDPQSGISETERAAIVDFIDETLGIKR
jgi:hypothetical protein